MYMEKTDKGEQKRTLYIQTLGTVRLTLGGRTISLHTSITGKACQLFLLLAYAGTKGITRTALQDALYDRKTTDAANALRINASRLRKLLMRSELPEHNYIVVDKNVYYLTEPEYTGDFQVDVVLLEQLWEKIQKETEISAKRELLEKACKLYEGEFLPALSGEVWVENLRGRFQEIYFNCVQFLCEILKQQQDYKSLVRVTADAMRLYPTEEWAKLKMDGFVGLQKYKEAMEAYKDAVKDIFSEQGMAVSDQMWERFKSLNQYIENQSRNLENIKEWLCEKERIPGAYCCSYPGFIDCYRMEARAAERKKRHGMLMICTIRDRQGAVITEAEKLQEYMDKLDQCVCVTLRRGDIYTRYSRDQILILVNDLKPEKAVSVENRIIGAFRKEAQGKAEILTESISLKEWLDLPEERPKEKEKRKKTERGSRARGDSQL
mgnify:FL=1